MSFGNGMVHFKYSKQKLNTKISTEAEVVGVSDYLTYNIWICLFMGAQGYDIKRNILSQNNQSTINKEKWEEFIHLELQKNDKRLFFAKNRIKRKLMSNA